MDFTVRGKLPGKFSSTRPTLGYRDRVLARPYHVMAASRMLRELPKAYEVARQMAADLLADDDINLQKIIIKIIIISSSSPPATGHHSCRGTS
jgi:hypothetical protein